MSDKQETVGSTPTSTTKDKGNLTELKVAVRLVELGYRILFPFGDICRYDLAIDQGNGRISRVQCKTGVFKKGCVHFKTESSDLTKKRRIYTEEEIEYFGVWCPATEKTYLVPVGVSGGWLRVEEPTRQKNRKNIKWAKDYEI